MLAGGLRIEKNVEGECRLANQHFKTIYGRQATRARRAASTAGRAAERDLGVLSAALGPLRPHELAGVSPALQKSLLIEREIGEGLLEAAHGLVVDPLQSIEDRAAITSLCRVGRADPLVDEVVHLQSLGCILVLRSE